jgi:hypothetical protein
MEYDDNNSNDDRPSTSKLLGTSPEQIKRQNGGGDEAVYRNESPKHTLYNLYIGTASIILVILGIVILGIWFFSAPNDGGEETVSITPERFFAINDREEIQLQTSTDIQQRLKTLRETDLAAESFLQIYFTQTSEKGKRLVTGPGLLQRLSEGRQSIAPYINDAYMLGYYTDAEGAQYPYLVFKVRDYERSYGTLLQTESTLVSDLRELSFPPVAEFSDAIILNQDVRVATGGAGRYLYYSFPRRDTLVITTNETVLREIFNRL